MTGNERGQRREKACGRASNCGKEKTILSGAGAPSYPTGTATGSGGQPPTEWSFCFGRGTLNWQRAAVIPKRLRVQAPPAPIERKGVCVMAVIRNKRPLTWMFSEHTLRDTESGETFTVLAPTNCNALFPSHQVWQETVNAVAEFYDLVPKDNLAEMNERERRAEKERQARRREQYSGQAEEQPSTRTGFVYLLEGGGFYKVGLSKDVPRRMEQIQPKLPFVTELVCAIATKDMDGLEAELHSRFADRRANGEWFRLRIEDIDYIKGLANDKATT